MKGKSYITLASVMALSIILLPTTSQAEVYWSLSLGHGVQLQHNHYQHRHGHHGDKRHHVKRHHIRKHHYQPRRSYHGHHKHHAYHHNARHGAYPYAFIPRHRPYRW